MWAAGCRTFFVALPGEGVALRALLPDAEIAVFNGCDDGCAPALTDARLTPVLNHSGQIAAWTKAAARADRRLPAMLHVDTGMSRLGLTAAEVTDFAADPARLARYRTDRGNEPPRLRRQPEHPLNAEQRDRFGAALATLAPLGVRRTSLANSSGIFLGPDYHFDLVRPGAALYGVTPNRERAQSHGSSGSTARENPADPHN